MPGRSLKDMRDLHQITHIDCHYDLDQSMCGTEYIIGNDYRFPIYRTDFRRY